MLETIVTLKPRSEWRTVPTWYSAWAPEWAQRVFRHITPDRITEDELVRELNDAVNLPGLSNAWTMPARTGMLTTGIRTPLGLKISGADVKTIDAIGARAETILSRVPGARRVFAERNGSGYFLDIKWTRREAAASEGDDRRDDLSRSRAHHVGERRRLGRHEAYCRAARRRHRDILPP
jgi:Cu(I)/Ag(I) efflux system membrane protein CusA/SilA